MEGPAVQFSDAEILSITNQLVSMRDRLDGTDSLVRRGRIRRTSSLSRSRRHVTSRMSSSSTSSSGRQMPAAPAATSSSVLPTVNEQRVASVPAVAADDGPSSVQQEDASRVGIAAVPSPLPTVQTNNEESTQSTGRIDTIDEVVIIDGTLKEADDVDNNTNEEEERDDRQK